jgi:hypothetical protein
MRTGIMNVMDNVAGSQNEEPEPSLDEMVAAFEAGEPVELVRSPRKLIVEYRYEDGHWVATSPRLKGFEVSGPSLSAGEDESGVLPRSSRDTGRTRPGSR